MKNLLVITYFALMAPALVRAQKTRTSETSVRVEENLQRQMAEKRRLVSSEAISALSETRNALFSLDHGKKSEALAAIERATGKLEVLLVREPRLSLALTEVHALTTDVEGDAATIRNVRQQANRLLDSGQVQEARHLLMDFASEIVIDETSIPLASYPDALRRAAKLLDENKLDQAKVVLQTALNTLVVTETVIPIPVLVAELWTQEAETLATKKARSPEENKQIAVYLDSAKKELEFAEILGYGNKSDFKNLYTQLNDISGKTKSGKLTSDIFGKMKVTLSSLSNSVRTANNKKEESKATRQ
jgi:hypothetical protein